MRASLGLPRLILREPSRWLPVLRLAKRLIARRPDSLRLVLSALASEGRRFASTEEGQRLQQRLTRSELVRRGRIVWQTLGADALVDPQARPAGDHLNEYADALLDCHLETLLADLEEADEP